MVISIHEGIQAQPDGKWLEKEYSRYSEQKFQYEGSL